MANETTDPAELSKEELAERRREIKEYYEDNIPSLKIQKEYEELLRDIEKARAERLQAQMFVAQTMAGPPSKDDMPPAENPAVQRGRQSAQDLKAKMAAEAKMAIDKNGNSKRTLKKAK